MNIKIWVWGQTIYILTTYFHNVHICSTKYENMGIAFPMAKVKETEPEIVEKLKEMVLL